MSEYISREAAIEAMGSLLHQNFLCVPDSIAQAAATAGYLDGVKDADIRLRSIPAADVRPVVRGTWVGIDDFPHEDWECDHCGCVVGNTDDPWNYYHFCPNCGADMRGES